MEDFTKKELKLIIANQKDEITAYTIYTKLSLKIKNQHNSKIISEIAKNEKSHYEILKTMSGKEVKPGRIKVFFTILSSRILGLTFTLKLLEKAEENTDITYGPLSESIPKIVEIMQDEDCHEKELLNLIDEERLNYMGSVVLGLNDALVELTGALAGYTFAIQNSRLIAIIGLITGIAASLSMASSEFLSKKQEGEGDTALLASIYTGIAYVFTVAMLITPFLLFQNYYLSLGISLMTAILIIFFFNYYISVAKDLEFKKRFLEMAGISLGVSALSFGIGWIVRSVFGIEV